MLLHRKPNFRRKTVNKFSAEFNGMVERWIMAGKHASADAVTSFDNFNLKTGAGEFKCGRQSGGAGSMIRTSLGIGFSYECN